MLPGPQAPPPINTSSLSGTASSSTTTLGGSGGWGNVSVAEAVASLEKNSSGSGNICSSFFFFLSCTLRYVTVLFVSGVSNC